MPDSTDRPDDISHISPSVTFVDDEQSVNLRDTTADSEPVSGVSIPDELPILPLRGLVVYPQTAIPLTVGQPRSIRLVDEVVASDRLLGLVAARDPEL